MAAHKYKIGQMVEFKPVRTAVPASAAPYKIIRLMPVEGVDVLYRIKAPSESYERIAKETELTRR